MPISAEQHQAIEAINISVEKLIEQGASDKTILANLYEHMPIIKSLLESSLSAKFDSYCQTHRGFFYAMKLLEHLAEDLASGKITPP